MDRYLFSQFVFDVDDETHENSCLFYSQNAKFVVKKSTTKKVTFNYFPQEKLRLQFVTEGILNNGSVQIGGFRIHHSSSDVWKLKILSSLYGCDGSYLVTRPDGEGVAVVRLVNEQVLEPIECDSIIEAQMVAFALDINIYQDEDTYINSVQQSYDGEKYLMKDGLIVATEFLVNNSGKLTDEERHNKDHSLDNIVDIRGTINMCYKCPLNMFGMNMNDYYIAAVTTDFGDIKIIIPRPLLPDTVEGFGVGNVIVGKVLLSGDVCIYDYEKYASEIKNNSLDS